MSKAKRGGSMRSFAGSLVVAACTCLPACATTPDLPPDTEVKSVVMDVEYSNRADPDQKKLQARDEISKVKPEPVYSTSYAINLAELALKGAGANGEGRNTARLRLIQIKDPRSCIDIR
jgi:hypothetical protein